MIPEGFGVLEVTKKVNQVRVKKAVTRVRLISLTGHHQELELMESQWST